MSRWIEMVAGPTVFHVVAAGLALVAGSGSFAKEHAEMSSASETPAAARPPTRVAFHNVGGHVILPVRINGSRELSMILDTGMSAPIIMLNRRALEDELHLKNGLPTLIAGAGGQAPRRGAFFTGARVAVGGFEQDDQTLIVLRDTSARAAWTQDGVIGKSIFDRHAVEIDYDASALSIHDGPVADSAGLTGLSLSFAMGIPIVEADVQLENGEAIPVRLVVDLGARHALSLHLDPEKGLLPPARTLKAIVGRGIQGEVEGEIGRIRGLRLGPFVVGEVITSFTDPAAGVAAGPHGLAADGNLGADLLSRFRLIVDYPRARLLVAPREELEEPFECNMAGLSLEQQMDGSFLVRSVVAESPGAAAGIARGDRIVGIGGSGAGARSYGEDMALFRQEGKSLEVAVERDGKRFKRTLVLKRLI